MLSLVAGAAVLAKWHAQAESIELASRAREVADFEQRRLTAVMNYRLNELREELFHLYGEQLNLARVAGEVERGELLFFRRDHLAAFAVMVRGAKNKWELQKHYLRPSARAQALEVLKKSVESLQSSGGQAYVLKRADAVAFSAPWASASGADTNGYVAAFSHTDDGGRPFALVGVFRPSYTFPFCRFFGETFGALSVGAFVLDERQHVVCHSQARFEGTDFSSYGLKEGGMTYVNASGVPATASAKSATSDGVLLVAEVSEIGSWPATLPFRVLTITGGLVLLISGVCAAFLFVMIKRLRSNATLDAMSFPANTQDGAPVVGLNEFTKLRRELKELETTLLHVQSSQAFIAHYQKMAVDLTTHDDLGRLTVDYLSAWKRPILWCPASADGQSVSCGPFAEFKRSPEPFRVELGNDGEILKRFKAELKRDDLLIQSVCCHGKVLGLLVIAGLDEKSDHGKVEVLPQLAQIMGFVMLARAGQEFEK